MMATLAFNVSSEVATDTLGIYLGYLDILGPFCTLEAVPGNRPINAQYWVVLREIDENS